MTDLLVTNGTVLTVNDRREVVEDGAVAVEDGTIVDVGPTEDVRDRYDADRVIDADDHLVVPGFISTHVHVADILLRGIGNDRALHDWLFNVKRPGLGAMTPEDHAVAAALYCREALASGITTFVENAIGLGSGFEPDAIEAKLDVYDRAGVRNVYGHAFMDRGSGEAFVEFMESLTAKEPAVEHPETEFRPAEEALADVESLIETHHDPDGRQRVWPAPTLAGNTSPEGLKGAYELAERHDVMTTTHTAETAHSERGHLSTIEYLNNAGYLGERALLGHCVHVDDRDVRLIARSGAKVAHNPLTNLALGSGIAPVPSMIESGVTVALGTDNPSASDTVNMLNDMRQAALIHKADRGDAGAVTAEKVIEMATIDAARAIGRESEIGSIEVGKAADLVCVSLDHPHTTPRPNPASTLVYQTQGFEVETVVCDGEVVMADRAVPGIDRPDVRSEAIARAEQVVERAGLTGIADRPWTSASTE